MQPRSTQKSEWAWCCPVPPTWPPAASYSRLPLLCGIIQQPFNAKLHPVGMVEYFLTHRRVVQLNLFRDLEDAPGPPRQQEMLGQWLLWNREKLYYWAAQRKWCWKGGRREKGPKKSSRSKCERCNKSRKIAFVSFAALDSVFFGRTDSNLWPFSALIKGKVASILITSNRR